MIWKMKQGMQKFHLPSLILRFLIISDKISQEQDWNHSILRGALHMHISSNQFTTYRCQDELLTCQQLEMKSQSGICWMKFDCSHQQSFQRKHSKLAAKQDTWKKMKNASCSHISFHHCVFKWRMYCFIDSAAFAGKITLIMKINKQV